MQGANEGEVARLGGEEGLLLVGGGEGGCGGGGRGGYAVFGGSFRHDGKDFFCGRWKVFSWRKKRERKAFSFGPSRREMVMGTRRGEVVEA